MTISKISPSRTINKGAREEKRGAPLPVTFTNLEGVLCGLGHYVWQEDVHDRNTSSAYEYERLVVTAAVTEYWLVKECF